LSEAGVDLPPLLHTKMYKGTGEGYNKDAQPPDAQGEPLSHDSSSTHESITPGPCLYVPWVRQPPTFAGYSSCCLHPPAPAAACQDPSTPTPPDPGRQSCGPARSLACALHAAYATRQTASSAPAHSTD